MPQLKPPSARAGRNTAHRSWLLALAAAVLQACGGPPPPPPTVAKLTLTTAPDANPTDAGQGAPTIVRVYQLAGTAAFEKAEFFRLLNADAGVLGPDLVKRDDYLLAPGAQKDETLTVPDRVQALGVFAGYRAFQSRNWRVVIPVSPNKTTPVRVAVTAGGLVVEP